MKVKVYNMLTDIAIMMMNIVIKIAVKKYDPITTGRRLYLAIINGLKKATIKLITPVARLLHFASAAVIPVDSNMATE